MSDRNELINQTAATKIHYESTTSYKLIYVFRVLDEAHMDMLKVGDASIDTNLLPDQLPPNCNELNKVHRK